MTMFINEEKKCYCGAYFNSNLHCSNGHPIKKEVIIVGGGNSINEGIETGLWDKIKGKEIWSLNFAFKAMPYLPTREVWVDTTFWRNNIKELENLHKQGVICHCKENDRYNYIKEIIQHTTTRMPNKKEEENYVFAGTMGLCGMFALSLAVKEKYERIFLLGYDWGTTQGSTQTHFYQGKQGIVYQSSGVGRPEVYIQHNQQPKPTVKEFDRYKDYQEIYNVSLTSHIDTFKKLSYMEFYEKISQT